MFWVSALVNAEIINTHIHYVPQVIHQDDLIEIFVILEKLL